jgi:predicted 2-oxoglutarate/Fe(II)-dependent dioxygenase YbiX
MYCTHMRCGMLLRCVTCKARKETREHQDSKATQGSQASQVKKGNQAQQERKG